MRKIFFQKIKEVFTIKDKSSFLPLLILFVFCGALLFVSPVLADIGSFVSSLLGWIIMQLVAILGKILTWVIALLVQVAQYNTFINAPAVSKGWLIVRDICNMFFIALLLVIAFGTVLGIERYSYKRTLGALLLAAVVINFSKFICGFFIDLAQILMLTFVRAFQSAASGNFIQMLGMEKWLNISGATGNVGASALTGALFALILVIISLIVISVMMVVLAFRIIMLWLLVVLSPFAFVLNVIPGKMKSYSSMWWEKFTSYLIVGPVMAFFIWLSFSVAHESSIIPSGDSSAEGEVAGEVNLETARVSEAANPSNFAKFVVSISMLIGSLLIAQQLGVAGGKLAGKAVGEIQAYGTGKKGILKKVKGAGKGVVAGVAGMPGGILKGSLATASRSENKFFSAIGKGGTAVMQAPAKFKQKIIDDLQKGREDRAEKISKGKGNILDHTLNSFDRNFDRIGKDDRMAGQAAQAGRVKGAQERLKGKSDEELRVLAQMGTAVEKMAAAILLLERGSLKKNNKENQDISKTAIRTMAGNKPLRNQFEKTMREKSDMDLVASTQFNNLEKKSDQENFLKAIQRKELKVAEVVTKLDPGLIGKLKAGAGGEEEFSKFVLGELGDETEATELRRKAKAKNKEAELGEILRPQTTFKDDGERRKYLLAGGSLANVFREMNDEQKEHFVKDEDNKKDLFDRRNIRKDDLEKTDVVKTLTNHLGTDFMVNLSVDNENKKAILATTEKLIKEANQAGEIDTPEAQKLRKNYITLNKDKLGKDGEFEKLYQGASEEQKTNITNSIKAQIEEGKIKLEHLIKIKPEVLAEQPELTKAIAVKFDLKRFKELHSQNSRAAKEVIKKVKELAGEGDRRMVSLVEDVKHSQIGYLVEEGESH